MARPDSNTALSFDTYLAAAFFINIDDQTEYRALVAATAAEPLQVDAIISDALTSKGYALIETRDVMEKMTWFRQHGAPQEAVDLIKALTEEQRASIGKTKALNGLDTPEQYPYLNVIPIPDFPPLDGQSTKRVPPVLFPYLFGELSATSEEDGDAQGLLKTYAVLDAAKLQWGRSEIEDSRLNFKCLFKGKAEEALSDVAPYLIELCPDSDFTQKLFTYNSRMPDAMTGVHLWHKAPAIYLRSSLPLEALWQHLRRFTQLQDNNGKRYFFRFYDPIWIEALIKALGPERSAHLFSNKIACILAILPEGESVLLSLNHSHITGDRPLKWDDELKQQIGIQTHEKFAVKLSGTLSEMFADFSELDRLKKIEFIQSATQQAKAYNFLTEKSVGYFTAAIWLMREKGKVWIENTLPHIVDLNLTESDQTRMLLEIAKKDS
ncbi:DUF4123 domain-containing protein [Enterovibrio sp. ZSDZ42]|uniref:DUF4123 domain-containing protein n=1 Tax=Enterovibrio gelatinilyticus TaxID=2899819 RepID=A0ABT5R8Q7_9GAMM|nr:DUF4123 domain-containing protein [Enterovibrio sp. ZSDZ42]MDD1796349.1 DUF4123 domain-containing protein [Enterovibrio sp. ZSDZ42]